MMGAASRLQCKVIKWLSLPIEDRPIGAADFSSEKDIRNSETSN
jgi:hypothetical protein